MLVIDADHATYPKYPESERGRRFIARLDALPDTEAVGVAIVTVEERMRGWLASIAKERQAIRQVLGYRELANLAATALVHDAILLSANRRDFERVPGLRVENWLD